MCSTMFQSSLCLTQVRFWQEQPLLFGNLQFWLPLQRFVSLLESNASTKRIFHYKNKNTQIECFFVNNQFCLSFQLRLQVHQHSVWQFPHLCIRTLIVFCFPFRLHAPKCVRHFQLDILVA